MRNGLRSVAYLAAAISRIANGLRQAVDKAGDTIALKPQSFECGSIHLVVGKAMIAVGRRAGFWRRLLSLFIDLIVVFLPFQALAAILFALTAGSIQFADGVTYTICRPVTQLPAKLNPAPPVNANSASDCQVFAFGAETARHLIVKRVTKDGHITTVVSQDYMLDKAGNPVRGYSLRWSALLALIAYLIWAKSQQGRTLGDRATKIAVVNADPDFSSPVRAKKLAIRYLVMAAFIAPIILVQIYFGIASGMSADRLGASGFLRWLAAALIPFFIFLCVSVYQTIRKRDPLYDRIAKTAVVRIEPESIAKEEVDGLLGKHAPTGDSWTYQGR
jgi:uncharacterized RDD family membrane protein YckC